MLTIALETVCFIIERAREFDVGIESDEEDDVELEEGDDEDVELSEGVRDDPIYEELAGALSGLNEDERYDLVALTWLGRGDFDEFDEAREQAAETTVKNWPDYLLGIPLLSDFLEEGLSALGLSCEDLDESNP